MKVVAAVFSDRLGAAAAVNLLESRDFRDVWSGMLEYIDEVTSFGDLIWLCFAGHQDRTYVEILQTKGLDAQQVGAMGKLGEGNVVVTVPAPRRAAEAIAVLREAGGDVY